MNIEMKGGFVTISSITSRGAFVFAIVFMTYLCYVSNRWIILLTHGMVFFSMLVFASGCQSQPGNHTPSLYADDYNIMQSRVLSAIPAGATITSARAIMEQDGWKVSEINNDGDSFIEYSYSCNEGLFVTFLTRVWIRHVDGIVTKVDIQRLGTGP